MQAANLNFSIVNAVFLGRRTICGFQPKPHIFLCHGSDTPFPVQAYIHAISQGLAQSGKFLRFAGRIEYGEYIGLELGISFEVGEKARTELLRRVCACDSAQRKRF
jgi:hypothetical protein